MKKLTIGEMKARNAAKGGHWFSKGTMKFFGTRIEVYPNNENIFITSEDNFDGTERFYTLRWFNTATDEVETLGEFQGYKTLEEARTARKAYTKSKKVMDITN